MFKLKKIFNSGVNVPEPEQYHANLEKDIKAGTALIETDGMLHIGTPEMNPTHITLVDVKKGFNAALCYRISPDMLFEVEMCSDEIGMLCKGSRVMLYDDGNGFNKLCDSVIDEGGAIVYHTNGASYYGDTICVMFK